MWKYNYLILVLYIVRLHETKDSCIDIYKPVNKYLVNINYYPIRAKYPIKSILSRSTNILFLNKRN